MTPKQAIDRLYEELGIKINRSKIQYYDNIGLCESNRAEGRRNLTEYQYQKLKKVVAVTEPTLTLPEIDEMVNHRGSSKVLKKFLAVRNRVNEWIQGHMI